MPCAPPSLAAAELNQRLVELCPICIIGVDRQGAVTIFNPAAEALLGLLAAEVVGLRSVTEFYADPSEARKIKKAMHGPDLGGPGRIEGYRFDVKDSAGRRHPVKLWGFLLREAGEEIGSVGYFYDLTAEIKAEQARLNQEKMAVVLQMAGAVLHNLTQPLQVLLGDSMAALHGVSQDDPVYESLEAIHASARSMAQLMEKIRKVSRLSSVPYARGTSVLDLEQD
jgi:PAS domain S-box-containing protein